MLLQYLTISEFLAKNLFDNGNFQFHEWQDELYNKFHLHFDILTNDRIEASAD